MATMLLYSSCVKDTLYNTPHPDKGAVAIVIDGISSGKYVADIDGQPSDITGIPFVYPALIAPGSHSLVAYNRAEGFSFDGRIARVNASTDESRSGSAPVTSMPGYLYTACRQVEVMPDDTLRVELPLSPRVRDLLFEIAVTQGRPELIKSVTGTLSVIAGAFDMEKEALSGEATSTVLTFTREGDKLIADARLLGTMGPVQTLVLDIVFVDANRTQRTEVDLSEAMAQFNSNMTIGYQITGELETPNGMEQVTAIITDWNDIDGDDVTAEM